MPFIKICLQFLSSLSITFDLNQCAPFRAQRRRKGIRDAKGNELRKARFVPVWQVGAFVPPLKALHRIFTLQRGRFPFPGDEFAKLGIIWWADGTLFALPAHKGIQREIEKFDKRKNTLCLDRESFQFPASEVFLTLFQCYSNDFLFSWLLRAGTARGPLIEALRFGAENLKLSCSLD